MDLKLLAEEPLSAAFRRSSAFYGSVEDFVNALLYDDKPTHFTPGKAGSTEEYKWIRGANLGPMETIGPLKTDVMLVSASPMVRPPSSSSGHASYESFLKDMITLNQFPDRDSWYHTFMDKMVSESSDGKKLLKGRQADCLPVFEQELRICQPRFVIAFGSETIKAFTKMSKSVNVDKLVMTFRDVEWTFADGETHKFKLLCAPNIVDMSLSAQHVKNKATFRMQLDYLDRSTVLTDSGREIQIDESGYQRNYVTLYTAHELRKVVTSIMEAAKEDPLRRIIAVDMEWQGRYPGEPGAYLLTVQFSSAPGEGYVVVLHSHKLEEEGDPDNSAERAGIVKELSRLLTAHDGWYPRIFGHNLKADIPWLDDLGVGGYPCKDGSKSPTIRFSYMPAKDFKKCRYSGGGDTMLMYHAYNEKSDTYRLKELCVRELGVPFWNKDVEAEYAIYKAENGNPNGYGCITDDVLHVYGAADADMTRRLAMLCMFGDGERKALLDDDTFGNNCWEAFWRAHRASVGFLEIEETGFLVDMDRYEELCALYKNVYDTLLAEFQMRVNWYGFNPGSSLQRQAVLFGRDFGLKKGDDGKMVSCMPEDAISLNLDPIYRASDNRMWRDLVEQNLLEEDDAASTDKKVLTILGLKNKEAALLRDVCKVGHILDSVLSPPVVTWDRNVKKVIYPKGHIARIRVDGRVHSRIRQTLSTGRVSSADPNQQNLGKGSEEAFMNIFGYWKDGQLYGDYNDILDEEKWGKKFRYIGSVRGMYVAPDDWAFLQGDYRGAELAMLAYLSQDENMMEHVRRNALPSDDPDFYDMHSHVAVLAFNLEGKCEPTKAGLKSIGLGHLRGAAKAVAFGALYGRGARSILLQLWAEGMDVEIGDVRAVMDAFFGMYSDAKKFIDKCKTRVENPGWVSTVFNRFRRFRVDQNTTEEMKAKIGREFCNAPIQGSVADLVNGAIYNLLKARYEDPSLKFKFAMQIHDSLVLLVNRDSFERMYKEVLPRCMVTDNPIQVGNNRYNLEIDMDISRRWGEEMSYEKAMSISWDKDNL